MVAPWSDQKVVRVERQDQSLTIYFQQTVSPGTAKETYRHLKAAITSAKPSYLRMDVRPLETLDTTTAALVSALKKLASDRNINCDLIPDPPPTQSPHLLKTISPLHSTGPSERSPSLIERMGASTLEYLQHVKSLVAFIGSVVLAVGQALRHPKSFRVSDTIVFMEKTGFNALPIVGMIAFLLGLVMAFMSSLQLKQFGANIYVASLVAIAMISELGPIMTAIVVAGRSGSAYAAEIGTMKIAEEVDALTVMGFNPVLFLALPRIVAAVVVIPLLTLFADLFAVLGGLTVGTLLLDLTTSAYINQTVKALKLFEIFWGLSKSVVFAILISSIGCLRGFEARGGSDAVGNATTSAVVTSIFLIILFDSIFAVSRSMWG